MKVAYYIKKETLLGDPRLVAQFRLLEEGGVELYRVKTISDIRQGTECVLSLGGDGTFLEASEIAVGCELTLIGVNLGRLGFLAGVNVENLSEILLQNCGRESTRSLLETTVGGKPVPGTALNEVSVLRKGTGAIGIDVNVDGQDLPTYWADGLLLATSSGSTAYNLSVGGPVCVPDSKVLVLAAVAPHNLGLRPLVLSDSAVVKFRLSSGEADLFVDNRRVEFREGEEATVKLSAKTLKTISEEKSNFIDALRSRFFWGQDVRNAKN